MQYTVIRRIKYSFEQILQTHPKHRFQQSSPCPTLVLNADPLCPLLFVTQPTSRKIDSTNMIYKLRVAEVSTTNLGVAIKSLI